MNLRKSLTNWLLKPEVDRLRALTEAAVNDYRMVPYLANRSPQALIEQLAEVDPRLVDLLTRSIMNYQLIGGGDSSEQLRIQIIKECRSLYLTDPLTQFCVELWTDYAFGESPNLTAADPSAQEVWDEFWTADRNAPVLGDRELYNLSVTQLNDGELFLAMFASTLDGETTCRTIPTEEIKEILYDPEDKRVVLYYRRDFTGEAGLTTLYYPDWHATEDQLARAKLPADAKKAQDAIKGTDVVVIQAAFRKVNGRGWPLATASIDWSRAYKNFLQDRAAVTKAAASVVEKIKAKGGQRAIDALRRSIGSSIPGSTDSYETNPPPAAGSIWLENESLTREWLNRPTNAGDAEKDGASLARQAGLGMKLYLNWLGHGESFRLATATSMEGPTLKSFNRYNSFWASIWRDMFKVVAGFAEEYGGKSFDSSDAQVSSDRIINLSTDDLVKASTSLNDMVDRALIGGAPAQAAAQTLLKTVLETIGIQGVDEILQPGQPTQAKEAGARHDPFR